jgi:hypothetical protein
VIAVLARAPMSRLLRTPRAQLAVGVWFAVAVAFAVAARGTWHAADHAMLDAYGPLVLPLLAYAMVGAITGPSSLSRSVAPLVAFGVSPARAASAAVVVAVVACTAAAACLAAGVDVLAHGSADPPLWRDSMASAYAGGLGGAAYAAWLMLGTSVGKQGGGRLAFLLADWVLGANDGAAALVTPRGHLRNLLGGTPPMDLPQRASAAALVVLAIACALLSARRAR